MGKGRIVDTKPASHAGPLWGERLQLPQLRWTCMGKAQPLRIWPCSVAGRRSIPLFDKVSGVESWHAEQRAV